MFLCLQKLRRKSIKRRKSHLSNTWQAWLVFCLCYKPSICSLKRGTIYSDHILDISFLLYLTQLNKEFIALRKVPSIGVSLISLIVSQGFLGFFVILTLLLGICCSELWYELQYYCTYKSKSMKFDDDIHHIYIYVFSRYSKHCHCSLNVSVFLKHYITNPFFNRMQAFKLFVKVYSYCIPSTAH